MSTFSKLNPVTKEYLGKHTVQNGASPRYPYYTDVEMSLDPKEGFAIVFDEVSQSFIYMEDHRQRFDSSGSLIGGTPFWFADDDHDSPAKYMTVPGPLPEGCLLAAPIQQFTTEELADQVREIRNAKLASTEWIITRHRDQLDANLPLSLTNDQYIEWLAYRQELRDIPEQPGFPWTGADSPVIPWPTEPTAV